MIVFQSLMSVTTTLSVTVNRNVVSMDAKRRAKKDQIVCVVLHSLIFPFRLVWRI